MLLTGKGIKKEFGIQTVLDIDKIEIMEGARIGLVGRNGIGKSTLLSVLAGSMKADEGIIKRNCEIAFIRQNGTENVSSKREEINGQYISRLGLKNSAGKSGGEKTRLAIGAAFSKETALLFADEPTTNLDKEGILLLEQMLKGFRGAFILISHDRMLLDGVCNEIWELEDGKLRCFPGSYSDFLLEKGKERQFAHSEYEAYQREKQRLQKRIASVKKDAAAMQKPPKRMGQSEWMLYKNTATVQQKHVQSRAKAMESRMGQLEKKEKPKELPEVSMKLPQQKNIKAKIAAKVEHLTIAYGEKVLMEDTGILVEAGKKTFLTGANGSGKTTLLKCLLDQDANGFITEEARVGIFAQEQENLEADKTVLENVMSTSMMPEHIARAVLMNLYMKENDMKKAVKLLSGGEKVKTALGKLLVSGCNVLILDEPTNHMDIYTMEGLEKLLASYDGTALIVSHDRRLTEKLADIIYEIRDKKVVRIREI